MDMDCKVDFIEKKWLQRKYQLQNYFSSLEPKHINPEKPDVPLNKNDAFQKVQKRRVQEKR